MFVVRWLLVLLSLAVPSDVKAEPMPRAATADAIVREIDNALASELSLFYPRAVDDAGGFNSTFKEDWTPVPRSVRQLVFQSRMTWTAAEAIRQRRVSTEEFSKYVRHGVEFLRDRMWDREMGGFFRAVDPTGNIEPSFGDEKHVYGMAFAIYALANAHAATGDDDALALARDAFHWLEKHAHDARNGGFYDEGTAEAVVKTDKIFWVQAEGLNALWLMFERTGEQCWFDAFQKQWTFIRDKQIDPKHGGWFVKVSREGVAISDRNKADDWKAAYHTSRALFNVSKGLHAHLAGRAGTKAPAETQRHRSAERRN